MPDEGQQQRTVCYICRDYKDCTYLRPGPGIGASQTAQWICEICRLGWLADY
jgi:hypothetical protein